MLVFKRSSLTPSGLLTWGIYSVLHQLIWKNTHNEENILLQPDCITVINREGSAGH